MCYNGLMFKAFLATLILFLFSFFGDNRVYAVNDVAPIPSTLQPWEDPSSEHYAPYNPEGSGSLYDTVNDPDSTDEELCIAAGADGCGGSPSTGGGGPTATESAAATQEDITAAIQAYVVPTSTRNFSLSNLNSGNEASLIISSGNEENNIVFRVIRLIAMLVGTVAILLYIIAGYFMIFSQGEENQLTKGKQIATFTSLGLVLAFGAYMIVQVVMGLIYFTT